MDFSRLMASLATALDKLEDRKTQYLKTSCKSISSHGIRLSFIICWLKIARIFFICSTTLADYVELRIEANNDSAVTSRLLQTKVRMRKDLESLIVMVEDVVRRILDDERSGRSGRSGRCSGLCSFSYKSIVEELDKCYDLKSIEEEMDKWYTRFSEYLQKYSTSPLANRCSILKVVLDSVCENLKDFFSTYDFHYNTHDQLKLLETVVENIPFLINFIRFGTFVCAENQEFQYSVTQIELLAIGAAQINRHMFSVDKGPIHLPNGIKNSEVSPFLHEAYAPALASLKHSQESHNPALDLNDYPFVAIMEDFLVSLLSTLWKMLQLDTVSVVSLEIKLQTVYRGLRFLRIILKNQPEKFEDGKIRATAVASVCDAGVIIFSLDRKDFEMSHANQDFSENIQLIRSEVIGYVLKTNFPQTDVLGFLEFLLEDYMKDVKGSKVDSDSLSSMPEIQEYLVLLRSFMGNLLVLRNRQKNAHQDLWDVSVEVAYEIECLMDQLVLGDTLDSFSRSLQSITEGITCIKAKSLNLFDGGRQDNINVQEIPNKFPWSKMSSIAKLPHLTVLKLLWNSFEGENWEFEEEEEFPNLKFLKLERLNIEKWTAVSSDQFPKLEKLALRSCLWLKEIPEDCMGNVETLKAIEVSFCSRHVVSQVRKIEETQKEYGTVLQVHKHGSTWDYFSETGESGAMKQKKIY